MAAAGARASEESEYGDLVARLHGVRFSFLGEGGGAGGMLHPSPVSGGSGIGVGAGLLHPSPGSGGSGIGVGGAGLLHPSPGSGGSGINVPGGGLLHPSQGSGASGGAGSAGEGEGTPSPADAGDAAHTLQGMQPVHTTHIVLFAHVCLCKVSGNRIWITHSNRRSCPSNTIKVCYLHTPVGLPALARCRQHALRG